MSPPQGVRRDVRRQCVSLHRHPKTDFRPMGAARAPPLPRPRRGTRAEGVGEHTRQAVIVPLLYCKRWCFVRNFGGTFPGICRSPAASEAIGIGRSGGPGTGVARTGAEVRSHPPGVRRRPPAVAGGFPSAWVDDHVFPGLAEIQQEVWPSSPFRRDVILRTRMKTSGRSPRVRSRRGAHLPDANSCGRSAGGSARGMWWQGRRRTPGSPGATSTATPGTAPSRRTALAIVAPPAARCSSTSTPSVRPRRPTP